MNTTLVLGPSLDMVVEPDAAAAPTIPLGRRWIAFHPTAPTLPGGLVQIVPTPAVSPTDVPPVNVYAVFVNPHTAVPAPADRTPEWFFAAHDGVDMPSSHVPFGDPTDLSPRTIHVLGVKPGAHFLQTILEYPA